eukprot:7136690-Prymnesium_polylepis.1
MGRPYWGAQLGRGRSALAYWRWSTTTPGGRIPLGFSPSAHAESQSSSARPAFFFGSGSQKMQEPD